MKTLLSSAIINICVIVKSPVMIIFGVERNVELVGGMSTKIRDGNIYTRVGLNSENIVSLRYIVSSICFIYNRIDLDDKFDIFISGLQKTCNVCYLDVKGI